MLDWQVMTTAKLFIVESIVIIAVLAGVAYAYPHTHRSTAKAVKNPDEITYLPLGDSYTIGQSVSEDERWPNQLVNTLSNIGKHVKIIDNPSVTGYTTQNLIDRELPLVAKEKPDFVTIQIGVNDYVQGVDTATFTKNLDYIITTVQSKLSKPENLMLVTIPDYGKTPTGAQFGSPESSEAGVKAFNAIITSLGAKYNIPVADVFSVSQQVVKDPSLIAPDGLHPSGKQYAAWTEIIAATLRAHQLPQR